MTTAPQTSSRTFEPDTVAVRDARRFVAQAPEAAGVDEACLALLVSEVASNAVLHARTPFTVTLRRDAAVLRVAVVDSSPGDPVLRAPDPTRVTGRGLGIVDALAERWGVDPVEGGKSVWFEVPVAPPTTTADDLVEVRLLALPVAEHDRAARHGEALQRELELIRRRDPDASSVPHRLHALVAELTDQFGGVGDQPVDELRDAIARGDAAIDLTYRLPASAGRASQRLGELLDEVDAWCGASGHLLTLVTPDEAVAYRRWFLGEFIRQCAGEPPVPWPERPTATVAAPAPGAGAPGAEAPRDEPPDLPTGWTLHDAGDTTEVRIEGALDLVSAPALRDLAAHLEHRGVATVVVDLRPCSFLDSVGLSVIVAADARARDAGRQLSLRLGPRVEPVLRIAGLLDRLAVEA